LTTLCPPEALLVPIMTLLASVFMNAMRLECRLQS
jgi:hypothetical protein